MSVDPSAIPNFGGSPGQPGRKPASPGQAGQPGQPDKPRRVPAPVVPDQALVKQLLDRMKLKYVVDKEGDLVAPWKEFRTYFMFRGEKEQRLLSVRTFYDRTHGIDDKPRLLELTDEWNRRTLWPKVYTHTNDEGRVRLVGEAHVLIGLGVALDHFVSSTVSWVRASVEFDKWLADQLGLPREEEAGAAAEGAPGDAEPGT